MTKLAPGPQRKAAALATSGASPQRASGVRCMIRRVASTSALSPAPSGVSIQPGAMALTRMRSAAYSQARERVSWTMAPLLAL